MFWRIILFILRFFDAELAHKISIIFLSMGIHPRNKFNNLNVNLNNLNFENPLGLAAGFDKNAEVIKPIKKMGFGFIEIGTVTPQAQYGNKKPRVFRLDCDKAIINRNGFNNQGMIEIEKNIKIFRSFPNTSFKVGVNIGANKNSSNKLLDYKFVSSSLSKYADYITINVSSPNTPGLRNLQSKRNIEKVISHVHEGLKNCNSKNVPIFVKLSPEIKIADLKNIVERSDVLNISGLIISNTTTSRDFDLKSNEAKQSGGLSGKPLFKKSTELLIKSNSYSNLFKKKLFLIAAGGIEDSFTAYIKILSGAHLIQIYSALVFKGPSLINEINKGLKKYLIRDNFNSLHQARGVAKTFEEAKKIATDGLF